MEYEHDIFISYRREEHWTPWTRDIFRNLLRSYLQKDLGRPPSIFVDERLEVGQDWVHHLASKLAKSRVLIAIFSRDYFFSPWCLHELDLMLERQCATSGSHSGLIIPVIAHDGELIPELVDRSLAANVSEFRIAGMMPNTEIYQHFSRHLKSFSGDIANRIRSAPPFEAKWLDHHKERFDKVYETWKQGTGQILPTTQFKQPKPEKFTTNPRLKPKLP